MALNDLVATAVRIAHTVTPSLQVSVTHYVYNGQSFTGAAVNKAAVVVTALLEKSNKTFQTTDGKVVQAKHYLAFLTPIVIKNEDTLIVNDGTPFKITGPILEVRGLVNPSTVKPYYAEVWLG